MEPARLIGMVFCLLVIVLGFYIMSFLPFLVNIILIVLMILGAWAGWQHAGQNMEEDDDYNG